MPGREKSSSKGSVKVSFIAATLSMDLSDGFRLSSGFPNLGNRNSCDHELVSKATNRMNNARRFLFFIRRGKNTNNALLFDELINEGKDQQNHLLLGYRRHRVTDFACKFWHLRYHRLLYRKRPFLHSNLPVLKWTRPHFW